MNLKIYQQGEGPANTVGAFTGARAIIQQTLEQWTVLRGQVPNKKVHNWNGDVSPVVHQLDQFQAKELAPMLKNHMAVLQGF